MKWQLLETHPDGMRALAGAPASFDGPGAAYLWFRRSGQAFERLGNDVLVVRSDGARPCGPNVYERERQYV